MSSKNDAHKVLNVLERMGMVRKSDAPPDESEPTVSYSFPDGPAAAAEDPAFKAQTASLFGTGYESESVVRVDPAWSEQKHSHYTYENKSGAGDNVNETSFWDESSTMTTDTDKFMDVEEIYRALDMRTSGTDTIYLVEEYMRTLPDSLPAESRRAIIMKIVGASGFDFDKLLNDGIDRVTRLNEYAASFAQQTDKIVARHNSELDALEKQIQRVRELIGERKNLHKRQFLAIENEAQRLKEVLDFVTK